MKKLLKKISIYLFAFIIFSIFLSLAIFLIIIAQGGKVTRDGIEPTGIIRINSEPEKDIKVYLNDNLVNLKEKKIENLSEGEYTVRVEKEGFTNWSKDVKVETGIVKDLFVTLFPTQYELDQITQSSIDKAEFSSDGNYIIYIVTKLDDDQNGIWKYKLTTNAFGLISNKPERVYSINDTIKTLIASDYEIRLSYDNSKFLLINDTSQTIFSLNGGDNNIISLENVENIGFLADRIEWFKKGNSLIIEKDKTIYEYNISDNNLKFIYRFENRPLYAVNGQNLVFFTQGSYYVYNNNQKKQLDTNIKSSLPEPTDIWMSHNSENLLYIKSNDTLYFLDITKSIHTIGNYELISISPNGESAIVKNDAQEVHVFRSQYIPGKDMIYTDSKLLDKIFDPATKYKWSTNGLHIVIQKISGSKASLKLIDAYVANEYNLIESDQIVDNCYQYLANNSEFIVLLKDSSATSEANLYKIDLK